MKWHKINGLSLRHFYLIKSSFPRLIDLIYWPTIQIFLWGFISKFFTESSTYYSNTVGIILNAAIRIINDKIINITFRSIFKAAKSD